MPPVRRHDRAVLDAFDALQPEPFSGTVWRVTGRGRDPLAGSAANGRWSPQGEFEVLYTSLESDGALAEIGYRLGLEPVWPSQARHDLHRLHARADRALRFADLASLAPFGIDPARYASFDYAATQTLAGAAHFLDYDALIVPSARSPAMHLVLFLDQEPGGATILTEDTTEVDWTAWRLRKPR